MKSSDQYDKYDFNSDRVLIAMKMKVFIYCYTLGNWCRIALNKKDAMFIEGVSNTKRYK